MHEIDKIDLYLKCTEHRFLAGESNTNFGITWSGKRYVKYIFFFIMFK